MKTWSVAVGSLSSWNGWVIGVIALVRLVVAMVSDPNRTGNYSPLWLLLWFISLTAMAAFVALAMVLGLARALKKKPRPVLNILVMAAASSLGNGLIGVLAISWGLDNQGLWLIRLLGGAISGAFMFGVINTLQVNLVGMRESIRQLVETENQLLGYRDSAKQIIADEVEALKAKTRETLLPAIEKIQQLLAQNHASANVVQDLKQLINEDVRPLSKSVLEEAQQLSTTKSFDSKSEIGKIAWKSKFNLKKIQRPLAGAPVYIPMFPMVEFLIIDHRSSFRGILGAIGTVLVLLLIKSLTPKQAEATTRQALFFTLGAAVLSIGPAYWIMWQEYGNTEAVLWATSVITIFTIISNPLISYTKAVELNREKFEQSLAAYNDSLAKEVALFEQKLGLERRAWSRIIHGEVQSALTAAVTRLQRSDNLEPYELEMIKQDLNRAKENLLHPAKLDTKFTQAFSEIVLTWKSICDIKADISARAQRALDQNQDVRLVTNEIIKEAVSNAVRHGQAKNIKINLDRIEDDILKIEITNDGYSPARDRAPGLGSQMLNELTLNWTLNTEKNKTTLKAEVPISKN